ncbi:hypothetical protein ACR3GG_000144 [Shigella sonnei]
MFNWKLGILLAAAITITGCAQEIKPEPTHELPTAHVDWPKELQPCSFDFKFEKKLATNGEDGVVVVVPYKDWNMLAKCREAEYSYISRLTSMVCFYRQDLQEKRCLVYYPPINNRKD